MKSNRVVPSLAVAPDGLLETGHLWLFEQVAGAPFRFQMRPSGLLRFGTSDRVYETREDVPVEYQHAVRYVTERIDRAALRAGVSEPEEIVFFGVATHRHGIEYDWHGLPSFLGTDIWAPSTGFLPVDRLEQVFDTVGLPVINTFAREQNTRDFDIETYQWPESAWYDGPPAGLLIRDKTGRQAQVPNPDFDPERLTPPSEMTAELAVERFVTDDLLSELATELDGAVTVDALRPLVVEAVVRRQYPLLFEQTVAIDMQAFRSGVGARTQAFLASSA